jgi:hypothetical protein
MRQHIDDPRSGEPGVEAAAIRGRPFRRGQSGNPAGRPKGARNRATLLIEALLEGEAEEIGRKLIELAKGGDRRALKICLDRLLPARRGCPVSFDMPPIETAADLPKATAAILRAVAEGEITPSEAMKLTRVVETHVRALELRDLDLEKEPARTEEERRGEAKVAAPVPTETGAPQSNEPEGEPDQAKQAESPEMEPQLRAQIEAADKFFRNLEEKERRRQAMERQLAGQAR